MAGVAVKRVFVVSCVRKALPIIVNRLAEGRCGASHMNMMFLWDVAGHRLCTTNRATLHIVE
jgi:hypothetical protein